MKRDSWLVLIFLVTIVLQFISCTQNVPETQTEADTETATIVTSPTTELKGETETATTATSPTTEAKTGTEPTTTIAPTTHEPVPASFSVSDLTITPQEVTANSPVTIEVLVTNTGELSGSYSVILRIDDAVENGESITLEGGVSQKVTFRVTKWITGTYSVNIKEQSGTFVVRTPLPDMDDFMKGIYFNDLVPFDPSKLGPNPPPGAQLQPPRRLYIPPEADENLKNLSLTGANWIAISLRWGQETISSTKISYSENATATDDELRHVIDLAHSLGIRVLLMPMVHLSKDPIPGHINIASTFDTETQWQEWFASYRDFINYYATFSQEAGVDMLFIGNELGATTHREADWRRIIQEIRQRYNGPITYDSLCDFNYPGGEYKRIEWWDAVDYIGVGGYFLLTDKNDPTVEELKAAWIDKGYLTELEALSKKFNKPVIISEMGYPSWDGVNKCPACFQFNATQDFQEQADCYQAAFEVFWGKPWLKGMFWFTWSSNPSLLIAPPFYSPYGKPAEEVLKSYYLSDE